MVDVPGEAGTFGDLGDRGDLGGRDGGEGGRSSSYPGGGTNEALMWRLLVLPASIAACKSWA